MPTRFLSESICTSDQIEMLTSFDEVVFYRLMVNADDYGRFDARTPIIKSRLFPLKDVKDSQIEKSLSTLASVGLTEMYKVGGRPFVRLTGWGRFQSCRAKKSKYPSPEEADEVEEVLSDSEQAQADVSGCKQMLAKEIKPEAVYELPLNYGTKWPVTKDDLSEYRKLYPAVDVDQEIRKMIGWCNANPKKLKTKAGVRKFINSWLSKEQDKGGSKQPVVRATYQPDYVPAGDANPFLLSKTGGQ